MRERKTVFTLSIDNYAPEITALTFPLMRRYAERIGADFHVISERKYPTYPHPYEKLQIYQLAQEMDSERIIFFDADTLIHPELIDLTYYVPRDTVAHNARDMANLRFRYDKYFKRDGRDIGTCGWLIVASDWTLDLFHPLEDMTMEEAISQCSPTVNELNTGLIDSAHLLDDYVMSRNVARYGLKHMMLIDLWNRLGIPGADFFYHVYDVPVEAKVKGMKDTLGKGKYFCPACRSIYCLSINPPQHEGVCDRDGARLSMGSWNLPDSLVS